MNVWIGLLIAFISSPIMNFGLALQKRGAEKLPKIGKDKGAMVAKAFFTNGTWLLGTLGLLLGWGMYLFSTKIAPVSLVQPTLGMGLVVLALFSVFYVREKITLLEWITLVGMFLGIILLGISAKEEAPKEPPEVIRLFIVSAVILILSVLAYVLSKREKLGAFRTDALLGMVSGLFIGLGAIFARSMFLFLDHKQEGIGLGIFLPLMILSYLLGIGIVQSGFQHGKALVVVVLESVINKVVGILGGIFALNETLPKTQSLAIMRVIAFVLILIGSGILARFGKEK